MDSSDHFKINSCYPKCPNQSLNSTNTPCQYIKLIFPPNSFPILPVCMCFHLLAIQLFCWQWCHLQYPIIETLPPRIQRIANFPFLLRDAAFCGNCESAHKNSYAVERFSTHKILSIFIIAPKKTPRSIATKTKKCVKICYKWKKDLLEFYEFLWRKFSYFCLAILSQHLTCRICFSSVITFSPQNHQSLCWNCSKDIIRCAWSILTSNISFIMNFSHWIIHCHSCRHSSSGSLISFHSHYSCSTYSLKSVAKDAKRGILNELTKFTI